MDRRLTFRGAVKAIQPRVQMTRSFDQREVEYAGYVLCVDAVVDGREVEDVLVGVPEASLHALPIDIGHLVSGRVGFLAYLAYQEDGDCDVASDLRSEGEVFRPPDNAPPYRKAPQISDESQSKDSRFGLARGKFESYNMLILRHIECACSVFPADRIVNGF